MTAAVPVSRRERFIAFAAVVFVQVLLGAALLIGLRIDATQRNELVERLIDIDLTPPPPKMVVPPRPAPKAHASAAPKAAPKPLGGSPGPAPHAAAAPKPIVAIKPAAPPSGGGSGSGPAIGSGAGGGTGGSGAGYGDGGGTDLEQIAGAIGPSDYPRELRQAGIGGRVEMTFTVGPSGRVTSCRVTRSSGVRALDDLTCRLIRQRFLYRPSTDRYGRPIADEVEGEHDWIAGRR